MQQIKTTGRKRIKIAVLLWLTILVFSWFGGEVMTPFITTVLIFFIIYNDPSKSSWVHNPKYSNMISSGLFATLASLLLSFPLGKIILCHSFSCNSLAGDSYSAFALGNIAIIPITTFVSFLLFMMFGFSKISKEKKRQEGITS